MPYGHPQDLSCRFISHPNFLLPSHLFRTIFTHPPKLECLAALSHFASPTAGCRASREMMCKVCSWKSNTVLWGKKNIGQNLRSNMKYLEMPKKERAKLKKFECSKARHNASSILVTSLPLKKARSGVRADRGLGLTRPLVYPPPPTDVSPSMDVSHPLTCHHHWHVIPYWFVTPSWCVSLQRLPFPMDSPTPCGAWLSGQRRTVAKSCFHFELTTFCLFRFSCCAKKKKVTDIVLQNSLYCLSTAKSIRFQEGVCHKKSWCCSVVICNLSQNTRPKSDFENRKKKSNCSQDNDKDKNRVNIYSRSPSVTSFFKHQKYFLRVSPKCGVWT